jgi:hypothetical protein
MSKPIDVLSTLDDAGNYESSTEFGEHATHLGPAEADIGQGIFSDRCEVLRPAK